MNFLKRSVAIRLFNKLKQGDLVYLKQPERSELSYVEELWLCPETMNDVGGAIAFPDQRKDTWYKKMVYPTDLHNFYCLIYNLHDCPIGEVSFHGFDNERKTADLNIKIQSIHRNKGYGKEAMKLFLSIFFNDFSGLVLYDNVTSPSGKRALLDFGFEIESMNGNEVVFKMTRSRFIEILNKK